MPAVGPIVSVKTRALQSPGTRSHVILWHANLHAHLASAAANCLAVEYFALTEDIYNFEALVTEPLTVSAGEILLRDDPGLGVTSNPEALARYDLKKQP